MWKKIRTAAGSIKRALGTYLDNCQMTAFDAKEIRLNFPDQFTMGQMEKEENLAALREAVAEVCGKSDIKITLQLGQVASAPVTEAPEPPAPEQNRKSGKKASASEDEILKDALDVFGGTVIR